MASVTRYTDEDGFTFSMLVEEAEDTEAGMILGPPEGIKKILLPKKQLLALYEKLNDAYFFSATDVINHRAELLSIIKNIGVPDSQAKAVLRSVIHCYQVEYYGA